MAYDRQYRPVTTLETSQGSPYTPRYAVDLAEAINNYKAVQSHKVISSLWPTNDLGGDAWLTSESSTPSQDAVGEEIVIHAFAPRYIAPGYDKMIVQAIHRLLAGAGETTWRLRALHKAWYSETIYDAGGILDGSLALYNSANLARLGITYVVEYAEWETSTGVFEVALETFDCSTRNADNLVYFLLTAENSTDTTLSQMITLDVTPTIQT